MKKQVISRNENQIRGTIVYLEMALVELNELKSEYDTLNLRKLTDSDLRQISTGENFIKNIISENIVDHEIQGAKISRNKILEMIELPSNRYRFVELSNKFHEFMDTFKVHGISLNFFKLKDEKIIISKEQLERLSEQHSCIAVTEREHFLLEFANKLKDIANENETITMAYNLNRDTDFRGFRILSYDVDNRKFEVNGDYLLQKAR